MSATMTAIELARLVRDCRAAQMSFFRSRSVQDLDRSRALEQEVDRATAAVLARQMRLFDKGDDHE